MHGGHQVAKKVTNRTCPSYWWLSIVALSVKDAFLKGAICMRSPIAGVKPILVPCSFCLQAIKAVSSIMTRKKHFIFMLSPDSYNIILLLETFVS